MTEIMNLLHNPRPGVPGEAEYTAGFAATVTYDAVGRLKVTSIGDYAYAARPITLPAGDWVYSAWLRGDVGGSDPTTTENRGLYVIVDGKFIAHAPFAGKDKRYTARFHLDAETTVSLRLAGPSTVGDSMAWYAMILASKQDYDQMRSLTDANGDPLNLTWFDGNTYPRNGGGGLAS
ncbi:hypothetical protein PG2049B_0843 [Bifidobacterium pseudolongum subsp. globosum]|uniref:hypothetical protein n=1 Tax=Bifidobacterium pseudolongum TaxID=1694 RepID=UPI00102294FD|nr:hypothetical protein [Bifidobacterium pseudolongum]RYQ22662.1 hypothetical protein PG2049B_0843 [Bifidobacterium pseudolongum subsp. globosum]